MGEHVAIEQDSCPACGAKAEWNPTRQALACPYCGTLAPGELDPATGRIAEIDLVKTLRELSPEARGWQTETRSVKCRSCRAVSVFEATRVAQSCDFCGSPELVDYEEIKAPIRPGSLLPFRWNEGRVRESLKRWFAGKWLAPSRFKKAALVDTIHGFYLPYWTFDSRVRCAWTAESGTYYYTTSTERDSKGQTHTRRVRHVRWSPAAGEVRHFFDDEPVPASRGVDHDLLRAIGPFPFGELVAYDTGYLAGFVVEHYQVVLVEAAQQARQAMHDRLHRMCAQQVPGDTYRNLNIHPEHSGETFKHVLVPVWLLVYKFGKREFRTLVNGYSGKISGRYPRSFWKIAGLTALALAAIGAFALIRGWL